MKSSQKTFRNPAMPGSGMTLLLLSPWLLTTLIFGIFPPVFCVVVSFMNYSLLNPKPEFVGIENYTRLLQSGEFWSSLGNSLYFAVGTVPTIIALSLVLAAVLNMKSLPGRSLFKAGFFLPSVTSVIVIALIFKYLYATDGLADSVLVAFGFDPPRPSWLLNPRWAMPSLMAMAIWTSLGFYTILFLASMQSISTSLYEAAEMDGAGKIQSFLMITIPMLRPTIAFAVFLSTLNAIQVFPEIYAMTQGGPMGKTTTLVYWIYEQAFMRFRMGDASAASVLLFFVIASIVFVQTRLLKMGKGVDE